MLQLHAMSNGSGWTAEAGHLSFGTDASAGLFTASSGTQVLAMRLGTLAPSSARVVGGGSATALGDSDVVVVSHPDGDATPGRLDMCPVLADPLQLDHDADGDGGLCNDDDDDDLGADGSDACALGETGWNASAGTDHDGDGCRGAGEGLDDDGVPDCADACAAGDLLWLANATTDHDVDGCQDALKDGGDDDGVVADGDARAGGELGWSSNRSTDHDEDGCRDAGEDAEDNGGGMQDVRRLRDGAHRLAE